MIGGLVRIVVLLVISAGVGMGYARYRGHPLYTDPQQHQQQQQQRQGWAARTAVTLEEFVQHYQEGGLVLDARPRADFEKGHLAAPVIMNVPAAEAHEHMVHLLPYQGQPIILYCSSEACEDAEVLWKAMSLYGFGEEVRVYHPGWDGLVRAGLPTVSGPVPHQEWPGTPEAGSAGDGGGGA